MSRSYQIRQCITETYCADTLILPDEEIVVVNTHEHDDDDLGSFFGAPSSARLQPERGFHGTALSDHATVLHAESAAML